ncbi:hypothetical protein D3C72_1946650 [compost metagenome]
MVPVGATTGDCAGAVEPATTVSATVGSDLGATGSASVMTATGIFSASSPNSGRKESKFKPSTLMRLTPCCRKSHPIRLASAFTIISSAAPSTKITRRAKKSSARVTSR